MNHMTNEDFDAFKKAAIKAYTNGWCHIMALAIQKKVGGKILARVSFDEDAIHDDDFRVDHLVVKVQVDYLDAAGLSTEFENEHDLSEVFEVDEEWIQEQVERGELAAYTEQDVLDAGRVYAWIS